MIQKKIIAIIIMLLLVASGISMVFLGVISYGAILMQQGETGTLPASLFFIPFFVYCLIAFWGVYFGVKFLLTKNNLIKALRYFKYLMYVSLSLALFWLVVFVFSKIGKDFF